MDLTRITVFCFTASYAVALSLEAVSVARRFGLHRPVLLGFAGAGVFAHIAYLATRASSSAAPLSSPADWCLLAALVLAAVYILSAFSWPRLATGLFLLPVVLGLIAVSRAVSDTPIAPQRASIFWGQAHSWMLILATVSVSLGFLAGVMYLMQSTRLKRKLPPPKTFRLPSLETLERVNGRALGFSVWLVAGGFVSGIVLTQIRRGGDAGFRLWADPLVVCLAAMLGWLVAAETFRWLYPAARVGRKVAYLTLASFGFLVITIAAMMLRGGVHSPSQPTPAAALLPAPSAGRTGPAGQAGNGNPQLRGVPTRPIMQRNASTPPTAHADPPARSTAPRV
ncbi:MAG: cytochrome C assembly protein [Planctomycetota bacterium]